MHVLHYPNLCHYPESFAHEGTSLLQVDQQCVLCGKGHPLHRFHHLLSAADGHLHHQQNPGPKNHHCQKDGGHLVSIDEAFNLPVFLYSISAIAEGLYALIFPSLQMMDLFFFMFLLSIWVVAYGVAKQGILIHNEERLDWIVRGAVYEPYLIIFGNVPTNIDSE